MRTLMVLSLLAALLAQIGCQSSPTTKGKTDYSQAFAQGRYAEAYEESTRVAGSPGASGKAQAALVAGLSAQALGRPDDADRWLRPLTVEPNREIAGTAGAALGLIEQERGRHAQASALLLGAAEKLEGAESARAYMYAGDSLAKQGRIAESRNAYQQATARAGTDRALKTMIADRQTASTATRNTASPGPVKYAVQTGAFSTRDNAISQARALASRGSPRVVEITDAKGRRLYAVRVGLFTSRQDAESLRARVGSTARVVAAYGE
ncbi:MAG: SPOR domain-containing protein [Phycisphaerales bacterium]|nr:SPOR domain-containing protein [Phycisphaerales bacterium]